MPRKAAAASVDETPAPRRSSRIKKLPAKAETAPKKPTKPRTKKVDKEETVKEDKPKSTRGTKRKATEEPNGADEPAVKKAKPASRASVSKPSSKPASKGARATSRAPSAKPASRAGSRKPASKVDGPAPSGSANLEETIVEEPEGEVEAETAAVVEEA